MRTMVDLSKLCASYYNILTEQGLDANSPYVKAFYTACLSVPDDDQAYSELDMDHMAKINMALISRFRPQLNEEFGTELIDTFHMMETLHKEQNKETPDLWYKYIAADNGGNTP